MTGRHGFPRDMDPFALDGVTAERLITGAVDVVDAPPEYRVVARTLHALREIPDGAELTGGPAAIDRIAAAVVDERHAGKSPRARRSASRAARLAVASVAACGLILTGGFAAVGALPDSAQGVASTVLSKVGISVPAGDEEPAENQPPPPTSPTTSGPAPPTTLPVQPNPTVGAPGVPAAPPDEVGPTSPPGNGRADPHGAGARGAPPPTATGNGNGHPLGGPPGLEKKDGTVDHPGNGKSDSQ
jgi:hypothetical protein